MKRTVYLMIVLMANLAVGSAARASPETRELAKKLRIELYSALAFSLSEEQRRLVISCFVDREPLRVVAERFGWSVSTTHRRAMRALETLQKRLAEYADVAEALVAMRSHP